MEELIGARFSLISKSEIRYVGVLHEINEKDATIALENVYSFGTEGRQVDNFIPPSNQRFDYIVFKGGDVKSIDAIKDDEDPQPPPPQNIPQDPAIVNSRSGPPQHPNQPPFPHPPPGYPPHQQYPGYYPPQQFGRGFGPPPPGGFGPGPGFPPYGPPPQGYFGPPGQGFPQGPNRFQPPPPIGPPGQQRNAPPNQPQQSPPETQSNAQISQPTSELPVDNRAGSKQPSARTTPAPASTYASAAGPKPSTTETVPTSTAPPATRQAPTQQKSNKIAPAVPLTVNQKSFTPPVPGSSEAPANGTKADSKPAATKESLDEATAKAKAAVAQALAKLPPSGAPQPKPAPAASSIDALSKQMKEMGTTTNGVQRGRGGGRGGRGGYPRQTSGGQQSKKIEIPKSDYDFETANAKFNKEDLIKEAIASGSPVAENAEGEADAAAVEIEPENTKRKDSLPASTGKAYNKSSSFFDNISSEAKDREEGYDGRAHARQMRGEEFKRNVETFGQGNVDGGFRGRGRGYGRGRPYGGTYRGHYRGHTGPFRGRGRGGFQQAQAQTQPPPTQVAQTES